MSRAPRASRSSASVCPRLTASLRWPLISPRTISLPSGSPTSARRCRVSPSSVAKLAIGTWQPPCRRWLRARSALTRSWVSRIVEAGDHRQGLAVAFAGFEADRALADRGQHARPNRCAGECALPCPAGSGRRRPARWRRTRRYRACPGGC